MTATYDRTGTDWTSPGVYAVAPGVHRIPLPLPGDALRAVNVYAIEDPDGPVLVDSGWALAHARDRLADALATLGAGLADVRRYLVTHMHRDHYTQAVALRHEFGTRVSLGEGERPSLEVAVARTAERLAPQVARLAACGAGPVIERLRAMSAAHGQVEPSVWEFPDDWIPGDTDVDLRARVLRAIATPGHTRGHLVFRDSAAGLLFAGDHVLPHITPSIGFEAAPAPMPLRDFLDSLRLVRALPDTMLLPAHGPVAPSVHARVDELLAHHEARLAAVADTVARGASTGYESAAALTWTRRAKRFDELDPFNQMLAVTETAAHLDLLAAQGALHASTVDGVVRYRN